MFRPRYTVEVETAEGVQQISTVSRKAADALAARQVRALCDAAMLAGQQPNALSWPEYLEMLRHVAKATGQPIPDVWVRST